MSTINDDDYRAIRAVAQADRLPPGFLDFVFTADPKRLGHVWDQTVLRADLPDEHFAALSTTAWMTWFIDTDEKRTYYLAVAAALRAVRAGSDPATVVDVMLTADKDLGHVRSVALRDAPWDDHTRATIRAYARVAPARDIMSLATFYASGGALVTRNWDGAKLCLELLDAAVVANPKDKELVSDAVSATGFVLGNALERAGDLCQQWVTSLRSPRLVLAAASAVATADGLREHGHWLAPAVVHLVLEPVLRRETIGVVSYSQVSNLVRRTHEYWDRETCERVLAVLADVEPAKATDRIVAELTDLALERRRRAPATTVDLGVLTLREALDFDQALTVAWLSSREHLATGQGWRAFFTMIEVLPDRCLDDVLAAVEGVLAT